MKKSTIYIKIIVCIIFITLVIGTISAQSTTKFRNFLYTNAELICTLAHPTNEYIDSYIDDNDYLVIKSKCSMTDETLYIKIYISPNFDEFEIIRDDDFVSAFSATEIMKDLLMDVIKDYEKNSREHDDDNKVVRALLDGMDEMDGKQLSHAILLIRWLNYNL